MDRVAYRMTDCLMYWLLHLFTNSQMIRVADRVVVWWTDWLTDKLKDGLIDWLTDQQTDFPTFLLTYWLAEELTLLSNGPTVWLNNWPTDWLTDFLTDWPID